MIQAFRALPFNKERPDGVLCEARRQDDAPVGPPPRHSTAPARTIRTDSHPIATRSHGLYNGSMPARAAKRTKPRASRPPLTSTKAAKPATPPKGETVRATSNGRLSGAASHGSANGTPSPAKRKPVGWDYAPAPESVKVEIKPRYGHFINGRFVDPSDRSHFQTINPANERVLSEIAQGSGADVDAAVRSATDALPAWSSLSGKERGKYLYRVARHIQERARDRKSVV